MGTNTKYRNGLGRYTPGGTWHYRIIVAGKVLMGDTGELYKHNATKWLASFRIALVDHKKTGALPVPTLSELVDAWERGNKNRVSAGHLGRNRWIMEAWVFPVLGKLKVDRITTAHIMRFEQDFLARVTRRGGPMSMHSLNVVLRRIRAVVGWGVKAGFLRSLPCEIKTAPVQRRPKTWIQPAKVEEFLRAVDKGGPLQVSAAARVMLFMGMRLVEVRAMRWEDLKAGTYTPPHAKGKEARTLPIPPEVQEWLDRLPRAGAPWIFPARYGRQHGPGWLWKPLAKAGVEIGVSGLSPHRLRGSYATLMAHLNAADPTTIQGLMGHKNIGTTMGYIEAAGLDHRTAASQRFMAAISEHRKSDRKSNPPQPT